MSAAARDQRVSPAVASSRIADLENHLGVRLFNRTTRRLQATDQGRIFYDGAIKILDAISKAEAAIAENTQNPKGTLFVAAPLGFGKKLIAPLVPEFHATYPDVDVRLRMSDRRVDLTEEGLDISFFLGVPEDSNYRVKVIAECDRVLLASPHYVASRGMPKSGADLISEKHACLMLRFPGSKEFRWTLKTGSGSSTYAVSGPFEADDGEVLTDWAVAGHGIINKTRFEASEYLQAGTLVEVAQETPPTTVQFGCLYPHKTHQDPKVRLFIDFMAKRCKSALNSVTGITSASPIS